MRKRHTGLAVGPTVGPEGAGGFGLRALPAPATATGVSRMWCAREAKYPIVSASTQTGVTYNAIRVSELNASSTRTSARKASTNQFPPGVIGIRNALSGSRPAFTLLR